VARLAERFGAKRWHGRLAVLRCADQRAGRAPRRCVKTGVPTDGATRVRAVAFDKADLLQVVFGTGFVWLGAMLLRRPALDFVVAVSPLAWRRWQRSLIVAVSLGAAGAGLAAFGIARGAVPAIVFGSMFLVLSWALRARAVLRWWIGVRYRPARDEVVISRVSDGFDDDARRLFTRAVLGERAGDASRGGCSRYRG
jgi:hypothetical protein